MTHVMKLMERLRLELVEKLKGQLKQKLVNPFCPAVA